MYDFVRLWITINNSLWLYVTLCDSFLLFISLYYFVWLCMIVYNPLLHPMTTDYVWLCKTLLDTVWLCMTLYDSEWINQFHKYWPFFYSGLLYLTLFDHIFCCCSVWLCFDRLCLYLFWLFQLFDSYSSILFN